MNLQALKYLTALAKLQHFGNAARSCHITQPTLSMQLRKLEEELGVQLFERSNKNVLITPIGQAIANQAESVIREIEQLKNLAKFAADPLAGQFKLGIIPTLCAYLLPHILPFIKKSYPNLTLLLYEEKTNTLISQLKNGQIDAFIAAMPITELQINYTTLFNEEFYIALPRVHPLAEEKNIDSGELFKYPMLLLDDGHCLRQQVLTICQKGINQDFDVRATSLETIRHMVANNVGISLIPALAADKNLADSSQLCIYRPFSKPAPTREIAIFWRPQSSRKACIDAIAAIICNKMPAALKNINKTVCGK